MTPIPASSSEEPSRPRRLRPSIGNIPQDTTELDLWAFSDDLDLEAPTNPKGHEAAKDPMAKDLPAPRERKFDALPEALPPIPEERIRIDVNRMSSKNRSPEHSPARPQFGTDFEDLEKWENAAAAFEIADLPPVELPVELPNAPSAATGPTEPVKAPHPPEIVNPVPPEQPVPNVTATPEPERREDEGLSPMRREDAVPISLIPNLGLSRIEKLGMILLAVLLLLGGVAAFMLSLHRLPTESIKAQANDFPIKGQRIVINSATSYWRAPITEGPSQDVFRRGTQLLPVVEFNASADSAAIRVIFRNEYRDAVGDTITRTIRGKDTVRIVATAGFDDTGMHAAYRTGGSKPWTIEVLEAPSESAASTDFKKVFEMNIATTLR